MVSLTDREEDYLRTLYEVEKTKGYAKVKDVARLLEITPASVVGMMKKLSKKELIDYRKYEGITLTEEGRLNAKAVSRRHKTFKDLLKIIGVPNHIADEDAHSLEHQLHARTINQFTKLVDIMKNPEKYLKISGHYTELIEEIINEKTKERKEITASV
jgi:DtxR family transcriptional regulator, Mn-dependent transcriptional regulator